jgi:hypothetical protein
LTSEEKKRAKTKEKKSIGQEKSPTALELGTTSNGFKGRSDAVSEKGRFVFGMELGIFSTFTTFGCP